MTKIKAAAFTGLAGILVGLPVGYLGCQPTSPPSLPALAEAASGGGYRVVPAARAGHVNDGFYALPPDDRRGWEELAALPRGSPGWRGAILVAPVRPGVEPAGLPVYVGRAYRLYGEPNAVRAFADAAGVPCRRRGVGPAGRQPAPVMRARNRPPCASPCHRSRPGR
jgi:hypothetical protein